MQKEKMAAVILAVIIIGAVFTFLLTKNSDVFDNLKWNSDENASAPSDLTITLGDCADIDFTGYFSNGTVFFTTYKDVAIENDIYDEEYNDSYVPLPVFVTFQWNDTAPEGYDSYNYFPIQGFMEGILGLEEGKKYSIGPIPPEKGYGKALKINDTVYIDVDPMYSVYYINSMNGKLINIINNASVDSFSSLYSDFLAGNRTDIYVFRDLTYGIGDTQTLYYSWPDGTVVTSVNDTHRCWRNSPSDDEMNNFTWIQQSAYTYEVTTYPENCSNAVVDEDANRIIITHSPEIGQILYVTDMMYYDTTEYTVENLTQGMFNCSYVDYDGNTSYREFSRYSNVTLNECESIISEYPEDYLAYLFSIYRMLDLDFVYGVGRGAGEDLYFDIDIVKVYKTS